jgi:hypothetical protein
LNGVNSSTGSIDLTARARAILATARPIFIGFRELMSARGNALLQLSKPIEDDANLGCSQVRRIGLSSGHESNEPAIRQDVVRSQA